MGITSNLIKLELKVKTVPQSGLHKNKSSFSAILNIPIKSSLKKGTHRNMPFLPLNDRIRI